MGSYLHGPFWMVRFITFKGSVAERAEEYRVRVHPGSDLLEVQHVLPESAPGETLSESKAQSVALSAIRDRYKQPVNDLELVRAEPQPRPNRRDWTFEYRDPNHRPPEDGEARILVTIRGSEVTDSTRYIHVPESWRRDNRSRQTVMQLIKSGSSTILYLVVLAGAIAGIVYWGKEWGFSGRACVVIFSCFLMVIIAETANNWSKMIAQLNTAKPFWNQILITIAGRIQSLIQAGFLALIGGFIHGQIGSNESNSFQHSLVTGLGLGVTAVALVTVAGQLAPDIVPPWATYTSLDRVVPWIHHTIDSLKYVLTGSILMLLFAVTQHRISRAGTERIGSVICIAVFFGLVIAGTATFHQWTGWIYRGIGYAVLFSIVSVWILPNDRSFIPISMASFAVFELISIAVTGPHPYSLVGPLIAIIVILSAAVVWSNILLQSQTVE